MPSSTIATKRERERDGKHRRSVAWSVWRGSRLAGNLWRAGRRLLRRDRRLRRPYRECELFVRKAGLALPPGRGQPGSRRADPRTPCLLGGQLRGERQRGHGELLRAENVEEMSTLDFPDRLGWITEVGGA